MAKKFYASNNSLSDEVTKWYASVNGLSKKVVKAYCSVNGLSKQFFGDSTPHGEPWQYSEAAAETFLGVDVGRTPIDEYIKANSGLAYFGLVNVIPYGESNQKITTLIMAKNRDYYALAAGSATTNTTKYSHSISIKNKQGVFETWYWTVLPYFYSPDVIRSYTPNCLIPNMVLELPNQYSSYTSNMDQIIKAFIEDRIIPFE